MQFGFNQLKSDFSSLAGQIQNINDPKLNSANISRTRFVFGSGIYLKGPRFNLGFSIPDMVSENNHIYLLGSYNIIVNDNMDFLPGILFNYAKGLPLSYDINLASEINEVILFGLSYRSQKSIGAIIRTKLTPQFKIGYSFDYPMASSSSTGNNSHEFMISYLFSFANNKISKPRWWNYFALLHCPDYGIIEPVREQVTFACTAEYSTLYFALIML